MCQIQMRKKIVGRKILTNPAEWFLMTDQSECSSVKVLTESYLSIHVYVSLVR